MTSKVSRIARVAKRAVSIGSPSQIFGTYTYRDPDTGEVRTARKGSYAASLRGRVARAVKAAHSQPVIRETFEHAVTRLKLSADDLQRRRRELVIEARIGYAIALVVLFAGIAQIGGEPGLWGYATPTLCVISAVSAAFVASASRWRAWQIDHRKLAPYSAWLKQPDQWI